LKEQETELTVAKVTTPVIKIIEAVEGDKKRSAKSKAKQNAKTQKDTNKEN